MNVFLRMEEIVYIYNAWECNETSWVNFMRMCPGHISHFVYIENFTLKYILYFIFIFFNFLSKRLTGKSILFCLFLLYLGWKMTTQYADYMSFALVFCVYLYSEDTHSDSQKTSLNSQITHVVHAIISPETEESF